MSNETAGSMARALSELFSSRKATFGVIGLGYVGLPLALAAHRAGFSVIGFDIDRTKAELIDNGGSPMHTLPAERVAAARARGDFRATHDFSQIAKVNALAICVPTPLSRHREPDLSFIERTGEAIAPHLKRGQLVVLESTTYPGTTRDVLKPILEKSGLKAGEDFFLAYSPEREDPGNPDFETSTIPRVVGGDDPATTKLAALLYGQIVNKVVPVASTATAEAVKLTENIFRAVNIALVNELKQIYGRMGINVWDVIDAAKTKPFGFMPFYPGPGLGGHCIPIDPFYLTWKAREYSVPTRFIELAGEVNAAAPRFVIEALIEALSARQQKSMNGAKVLLLGMAYKKNVDDMRESPSLSILEMLEARGAHVEFYDPHIPVIPMTREHAPLAGRKSVEWNQQIISSFDAALICTDHEAVDYHALAEWVPLIVDTRNVMRHVPMRDRIVLA